MLVPLLSLPAFELLIDLEFEQNFSNGTFDCVCGTKHEGQFYLGLFRIEVFRDGEPTAQWDLDGVQRKLVTTNGFDALCVFTVALGILRETIQLKFRAKHHLCGQFTVAVL